MSSQVTRHVTQVQHGHRGPGDRDGGAAGPGQDLHRQEAHPLPQLDRGQHQVMVVVIIRAVRKPLKITIFVCEAYLYILMLYVR